MKDSVEQVTGKLDLELKNNGGSLYRPRKGSRNFAILRVGKLKGLGKIGAAARHNLRERDTGNARPEDFSRNIHLAGAKTADEVLELWKERAPDKVRTNAVHALEYVVTASPEKMAAMGQTTGEEYLRDAFAWVQEKHGAENILSAVIHNDETTPHLQVMLIPIDERGKLNARGFIGGAAKLSAMQTDFVERVGKNYGLERGIERSGARHEAIKSYYGRVQAVENLSFELPERATGRLGVFGREPVAKYHERVAQNQREVLRTTTAGFVAELDDKDRELENKDRELASKDRELAAKQKQLDKTEAERRSEFQRRHTLEVACDIRFYKGSDKQERIARFQKEYLSKCAHLPEETREIVDILLEDMGGKGFWHIEQERLDREEQERAAQEEGEILAARNALAGYEARSSDGYKIANSAEEHQEIIRLLKENTTDAQYDRFRRGDLSAIDHISEDEVFRRQLLMEVELNNRTTGFEMSNELENLMSDNRGFLKETFGEDRDHGYENER
ncbi:MobV family relaxase [Jannaschia rubra]|uniref:Plasmid recombination enzyme n=1 Tax=Jannaschia rubra TaxID=282197 RepID=A0A0M6XKP6_9RHOB|nr:MobV family relaxase [Jannaschia rubra]CTQ31669.1 Plasmid recombination enzyme [Jannaschia rubra]SFG82091.1 Plasmid recombination enzyme [Jannaschia rubra]